MLKFEEVRQLFDKYVVSSYGRFELAFERASGNYLWDHEGRKYLDLGGGIAVCVLGHANPEIAEVLCEQARTMTHISNLYYHELQGRLAEKIVKLIAPGKVFFCNSGAEANEGLYKIARKHGNQTGRYEIITALNSFHGRTLAGIAATGQKKIGVGFDPVVEGFKHVPFNDLAAMEQAITPKTAAILIEGVQGEGGITAATKEYLLGLRKICDKHDLLLMMDSVQCGHFRTGCFQSYQRILEDCDQEFTPDAISMAKSLGAGYPIGAFWMSDKIEKLLGPGSHGTTYGGGPLACVVALKIIEIIERDNLAQNARKQGEFLISELKELAKLYPNIIKAVRGLGLMIGFELAEAKDIPAFAKSDKPASIQFVNRLHDLGLMTIPSGNQVVRLLPALNLDRETATTGINIIKDVLKTL